jgi:hypothetical protein
VLKATTIDVRTTKRTTVSETCSFNEWDEIT